MPNQKAKRVRYPCPTCGKNAYNPDGCHLHHHKARDAVRQWWNDKNQADPEYKKNVNRKYWETHQDILKQKMKEYYRARCERAKTAKQVTTDNMPPLIMPNQEETQAIETPLTE
jgi:hypothetical protein